MKEIFERNPVIILTGGVSKGKKDFVPEVLEELGVERHFHRVAQRPGKPVWFGSKGESNIVFALPGNPVSTFLCYERYVSPWLKQYAGEKDKVHMATLAEDIQFTPDMTYFIQVNISNEEGILTAQPVVGKGSGDLANLLEADGFLELPSRQDSFKAGEVFKFIPYRPL